MVPPLTMRSCMAGSSADSRLKRVPILSYSYRLVRAAAERSLRARQRGGHAMSTTLQEVNLADPDVFVQGVPHDMFDVLRREAPVHFHAGTDEIQPFWCVVKNEDVRVLSRDYPHFSSERGGITLFDPDEEQMAQQRMMMLQMDPPKHTKLRVLVNKGFTPRMVGQLH